MKEWTKPYVRAEDLKDGRRPRPPRGVVLPKGSIGDPASLVPRNLTFTRKHALTKNLVRFAAVGDGIGATGTQTVRAIVYSPSNRLRLAIYAAFEADDQSAPDPVFVTQPTWSITALSRNPETGREVSLQQAYPTSGTKNLPDAYEADTALQALRVNITIADTAFSSAYITNAKRANLLLISTWEPNVNFQGSEDELSVLYNACSVQARETITLVNNAV